MRFKLLLTFLPLLVTVKADSEAAAIVADPHPHDHVLMPFHAIPRPIPRPNLVQPLVPPVPETPKPFVPTTVATLEISTQVRPRLPPARNIPRPIPGPIHIGPIPDPTTPATELPTPPPTRRPVPTPVPRPVLRPAPRPAPRPIPRPAPLPQPVPTPPPEPQPEPVPDPTPEPKKPQPEPRPIVTAKPAPKPIVTPRPYNRSPLHPYRDDTGISADYNCVEDGFYSVINECDSYINCYKRTALKYVCPDGLYFNKNTRWPEYPCAYPSDEVRCEAGAISHEPLPTAQCPRQYGFFAIKDSDCSRYISCQEGLATIMECPPGLVFNDLKSACDWPVNVPNCNPNVFKGFNCPPAPIDESGKPYDLIYKYRYGKSCKEYIACQSGHPRLLSCDAGLFFDEASETCIDADYVKDCSL